MNRLFLRIWGLLVAAVVLAMALETAVFLIGDPAADAQAIASRSAGAARLVRDRLRATPDRTATLRALSQHFEYPVQVVERLPVSPQDGVFAWYDDALRPTVALEFEPDTWVQLGPMPALPISPLSATLARMAGVIGLVAILLAVMLRRVRRRLLALESAARRMADGDLQTRVAVVSGTETQTIATAFNHMAAQVEAALDQREQLLRAVSHELRTPLTRAQLGLHLLDGADPDAFLDQLAAIEADLNGMNGLIQQLLDTARFAHPVPTPLEVAAVIDRLVERRQRVFDGQISRTPDRWEGRWPLDEQAFERAIGNLIDNAMRFAKARIVVDVQPTSDGLRVSVEDDGPGITAADPSRLFEPFIRGEGGGYGLGLALVRAATEAHGGAAWIETGASGGCRVVTRWGG